MQHTLGVDIGNSGLRVTELNLVEQSLGTTTRLHWAPESSGSMPGDTARVHPPSKAGTRRYAPPDSNWLDELRVYLSAPGRTKWWISSVRRDALNVLLACLDEKEKHQAHVVQHGDLPLSIHLKSPEKVGIDRLLAALAASRISPDRPLIVIQAGSAVTVDFVSGPKAEGMAIFEGGSIVPGVPMMLRLLGHAADMLPVLDADDLMDLPPIPGKNTEEAMRCGAASALVGGVRHLVERYRHSFGKDVPVILSGGDGMRIAPYLPAPVVVEPHLVQRGLLVLVTSAGSS